MFMVCAGANDALAKSKNAQVRFIRLIFGRLLCVVDHQASTGALAGWIFKVPTRLFWASNASAGSAASAKIDSLNFFIAFPPILHCGARTPACRVHTLQKLVCRSLSSSVFPYAGSGVETSVKPC